MKKIKSSELRIGNYILFREFYLEVMEKVVEITEERINIMFDDKQISILHKDVNPIHLTEEILFKCGFSKKYEQYYLIIHMGVAGHPIMIEFEIIGKDIFGSLWIGAWDDYTKAICLDIEHLHQLQNLYFALTGEELDVKL